MKRLFKIVNWPQVILDLLLFAVVVGVIVLIARAAWPIHVRAVEHQEAKASGTIETWSELEEYRRYRAE